MLVRHAILLLFPVMLNAQQRSISLDFNSTAFPKEVTFKVELKLHFAVIDTKTMQKEGRRTTSSKDIVFRQTSTNSANWNVSYDNSSNTVIEGSPQSMVFNFSKPVNISSDFVLVAISGINLPGQDLDARITPQINNIAFQLMVVHSQNVQSSLECLWV